jgi:sugar phosphate isomerase/epimerase
MYSCAFRELSFGGKMDHKLAMNTGTFSLHGADLLKMVNATSAAGFTGIELRDNHIQEFMQKGCSIHEIKNLLKTHELHPVAVHALRDWQNPGEKNRKAYRKRVEAFIEECKGIGCDCVACPSYAENADLQRDVRAFQEVCDIGKAYDMRLAIEFLPWAGLRDIRTAWEVVRQTKRPNGGLLVDTFHFYKGESRLDDLRQVPAEKIFVVHLDDAPDLPIDLKEMCMGHRLFPGEGVFPMEEILDLLVLEKDYRDWFSLEVFNEESATMDYTDLANKGADSLKALFERYHQ